MNYHITTVLPVTANHTTSSAAVLTDPFKKAKENTYNSCIVAIRQHHTYLKERDLCQEGLMQVYNNNFRIIIVVVLVAVTTAAVVVVILVLLVVVVVVIINFKISQNRQKIQEY